MASPVDFSAYSPVSPAVETPGMHTAYGLGPPQQPPGGRNQLNTSCAANDLAPSSGPNAGNTEQRSRLGQLSFDPSEYGLNASAFQLPPGGLQFSMPSFMQGGPAQPFPHGPAIAEATAPTLSRDRAKAAAPAAALRATGVQSQSAQRLAASDAPDPSPSGGPSSQQLSDHKQQQRRKQQHQQHDRSESNGRQANYKLDPMNPVYSLYGSSVVGVDPDTRPFPGGGNPALPSVDGQPPSSPSDAFDPSTLGLPTSLGGNFPGLYSSSGFDLMGVIARVAARPNPQINVGPVDTSCSFLVVDARKYDFPIVFASASFSTLTGFENSDVIGRNCRFLQSPDGQVSQGSKRKYTDANAVWHMKSHILAGKESQASIINYRKNGTPFINLVTIIPIVWDSDEIAYFVGFQVDLVEQPNAILDKMRDGTYVVNYSLLPGASMGGPSLSLTSLDAPDDCKGGPSKTEPTVGNMPELLDIMGENGAEGQDDESAQKAWYRSILDNTDDFVHVLSLKGAFLYVSPSVKRMLEYDEYELIGKPISTICHPSDSIPVMRELKESGNAQGHPTVSLLYRAKRKYTGFMWLEAQGKLHIEQGKGRKCVILVGRERPTYKMSWQDLNRGGGLGEMEFWTKLSLDGMCLYSTPSVRKLLGFSDEEMVGTALSQLSPPGAQPDLQKAIVQAAAGQPVSWRHQLKNRQGQLVDVVTNFFPGVCGPPAPPAPVGGRREGGPQVQTVVCQTNEAGSDLRRRAAQRELPAGAAPPSPPHLAGEITLFRPSPASHASSDSASSAPSTYSAVPSTFKQLRSHPSHENDNIFADLDTTKTSSWQFELHQLKLINKRLREELEALEAAKKKRKRRLQGAGPAAVGQPTGLKACANCGKTDSPEWRKGPSGQRDLCNACGLRYSKAVSSMSESPGGSPSAAGGRFLHRGSSPAAPTGGGGGGGPARPALPPSTSDAFAAPP